MPKSTKVVQPKVKRNEYIIQWEVQSKVFPEIKHINQADLYCPEKITKKETE